jgi:hypothetical protein
VDVGLQFYSGPTCGGSFLYGAPNLFGSASGAWAQALAQVTAPPGTNSAALALYVSCDAGCTPPTSGLFDDVSLTLQGTTAATMRSFTASRSPAGTLVRWRTAAETEVAGFNVYRVAKGRKVKLNKRLIAARGKGGGASYRFLDRGHRGVGYRLEVVNLDGTRQWRTAH